MVEADVERVRSAYDALVRGDVEPLIGLIDHDCVWRGVERRRFLFWRTAPI